MGILQDLRFAVRTLLRTPGFTVAVVLTLALGIGANTAVFSAVRGVLLRPLPHQDGEHLVYLRQAAEGAGLENALFSVPEILDYRTSSTALTGFAEFSQMTFNLLGNDDPVQVTAGVVSGNYFDVMGLEPVAGRLLETQPRPQSCDRATTGCARSEAIPPWSGARCGSTTSSARSSACSSPRPSIRRRPTSTSTW